MVEFETTPTSVSAQQDSGPAEIVNNHLLHDLGYAVVLALLLILVLVAWNRSLSRMVSRRTAELKASESRQRAILQAEPESVIIVSPQGDIVEINPAGLALFQASTIEEARQRPLLEYIRPEHREAFKELRRQVLRGENGMLEFELEGLRGARYWLATHATVLRDAAGNPETMLGVTRNITDRKRTEALTAGQLQVLEMIASGAPLNDTLAVLLRVVEAQSPDMLCSILLLQADGIHVRHGAAPSLPEEFIRAIDGSVIGPQAGSCGTAAFRRERVFVEDIATDPLWQDYKQFALPHGLRACWSTPICDTQNNVLGTFAIYYRESGLPRAEHIQLIEAASHTARICINRHRTEAALRESEERFRQSQKMEAIGNLASGIAHDFNNVLSAINGNAELALQDVGLDHPAHQSLAEIVKAGTRAKNLVQQILTFTRSQKPQRSMVALGPLVQETAGFVRVALPPTAELNVTLAPDAPSILANATQIQQVLLNLLTNAWHALLDSCGRIEVDLSCVTLDDAAVRMHPKLHAGVYAYLSVRDNGRGMDAATRARIFEPFFTTRANAQGTGWG